MTIRTSARAAALGALLLLPVLVGCAAPAPAPADDPTPTSSASAPPAGENAADLEYGLFYEPSMLDTWAGQRDDLAAATEEWTAACEPADTADPADDCNSGLQALLRQVNALKQSWQAFDNSEWDDTSLSGMVALKPTRDATLAASASGGEWSGNCTFGQPDEQCLVDAETFIGDVEEINTAFAAWPY